MLHANFHSVRNFSPPTDIQALRSWRTISRVLFYRKPAVTTSAFASAILQKMQSTFQMHRQGGEDRKKRRERETSFAALSTFSPHFTSINVKCNRLDGHYGSARQPARTSKSILSFSHNAALVYDLTERIANTVSLPYTYVYVHTYIFFFLTHATPMNSWQGFKRVYPRFHHEHFNRGEMTGKIVQPSFTRKQQQQQCACVRLLCVGICAYTKRGVCTRYFT